LAVVFALAVDLVPVVGLAVAVDLAVAVVLTLSVDLVPVVVFSVPFSPLLRNILVQIIMSMRLARMTIAHEAAVLHIYIPFKRFALALFTLFVHRMGDVF
jgi:hypothetical protein